MKISSDINENVKTIHERLPIASSFDVIGRPLKVGSVNGYIVFIDGFAKDDAMIHVMKGLQSITPESSTSASAVLLRSIPYIEAELCHNIDDVVSNVLCGQLALFIDGDDAAVLIDAREYPCRRPDESRIEKVTRGSRDDMVETLIFNTALIRRRVRDPKMIFEIHGVGSVSPTDIAIGYISDKVDEKLLKTVRQKIENMNVHSITMGVKSVEEALVKKRWFNPMPTLRMTERPDTVAAHLLEGDIVILVDASPAALIVPTTFFSFTQYVEDYFQAPLVGNVVRIIRGLSFLMALLLVPLYLLMATYPDQTPEIFRSLVPTGESEASIFLQVIMLELGLELLELSSLHTPTTIESAFSIIGGLILGDFAVSMGLLIPDSIFFTVASTVAGNCIPSPELNNAIKIYRWFMTVCTGFFGIWGFGGSLILIIIISASTKTVDKRGYFWPLIPFDRRALLRFLLRYPLVGRRGGKK